MISPTQQQIKDNNLSEMNHIAERLNRLDDLTTKALMTRILYDNFPMQEINKILDEAESIDRED